MAWEWSHTQEAYDYAREFLSNMPLATLAEIAAEWDTFEKEEKSHSMSDVAFFKEREAYHLSSYVDILVEYIWEKMEEQRTCTNGGFEFWACPYGCGCHMVPAGPEDEGEK